MPSGLDRLNLLLSLGRYAEGEKAAIRMILPVALFILPVIFVVLLVPAALELMRLGG